MDENAYNVSQDSDHHDQGNKGEKEKHSDNNEYLLDKDTVDTKNLYPSEDLHPSINCENGNELRRRRDDLNYPPNYPTLQQDARIPDNHIDISPMDFGFVSDSEDDSETTDEFHENPRYVPYTHFYQKNSLRSLS